MNWNRILGPFLIRSRLGELPVRVRGGIAAGAKWTLYPWSAYWRGGFEPAVQTAILGCGPFAGRTCWDIGAHFGIYSVGLARLVGPTGQVAAFEPNPFSFGRLNIHRRMNGLEWLKTLQCCVSDTDGFADFLTDDSVGSTSSRLPYDGEVVGTRAASIRIRTARLDGLVKTGELRPPWLVKIDAEGHGHRAARGMHQTLETHRPIVIMGFHSESETRGFLEIVDPLGYRRTPIGEDPSKPGEFIGRDWMFTPPG